MSLNLKTFKSMNLQTIHIYMTVFKKDEILYLLMKS